MEKSDWDYFVKIEAGQYNDASTFRDKHQQEALRRVKGFIKVTLGNIGTRMMMGQGNFVNRLITLGYAESEDVVVYTEKIMDEYRAADYVGNFSLRNKS